MANLNRLFVNLFIKFITMYMDELINVAYGMFYLKNFTHPIREAESVRYFNCLFVV